MWTKLSFALALLGSVSANVCNNVQGPSGEIISVMGHEPLVFTGVECFTDCTAKIECKFNDPKLGEQTVEGKVETPLFKAPRAICYAPLLYTLGPMTVEVTLVNPDGSRVELPSASINVIQSKPAVEILGVTSDSQVQIKFGDLSTMALTNTVSLVDIFLVWFDPQARVIEERIEIVRNVAYQPNLVSNILLPSVAEIGIKDVMLASSYVALLIKPSQLNNNLAHPFKEQAGVFSPFVPALHLYNGQLGKFKLGVCQAWYQWTWWTDAPANCSASIDLNTVQVKDKTRYSSVFSRATLHSQVSYTHFESNQLGYHHNQGQECYYDSNGQLVTEWRQGAGSAQLVSSYSDEREHYFDDEVSWYACCYGADEQSDNCRKYYNARRVFAK